MHVETYIEDFLVDEGRAVSRFYTDLRGLYPIAERIFRGTPWSAAMASVLLSFCL
jgi:hypothetical protein